MGAQAGACDQFPSALDIFPDVHHRTRIRLVDSSEVIEIAVSTLNLRLLTARVCSVEA